MPAPAIIIERTTFPSVDDDTTERSPDCAAPKICIVDCDVSESGEISVRQLLELLEAWIEQADVQEPPVAYCIEREAPDPSHSDSHSSTRDNSSPG
jgi:hypothetical protein